MTHPVGKALWFIETRLGSELSLADIARCAGVSRYNLLRAFGIATGHSVMRYVRGRRLTEAARRLAAGAPDILTVALDAGYGSHEAFTRAFRDQFGVTPEFGAHATTILRNLALVEPIAMDDSLIVELDPPRFEDGRTLLIVGLGERYSFETNHGIPQQWQRFQPYIGNIPGQIGRTAYGVCCNGDGAGNFEYIAGVEVAELRRSPPASSAACGFPPTATRYSPHRDHISRMRATVYTIWNQVAARLRSQPRRCAGLRAVR